MQKLSIYIHIPFCIKKCAYCDFLSAPADSETKQAYIDALCHEIDAWKEFMAEYEIDTIFLGGGTPSCLESSLIKRVLCKLKENFRFSEHVEISIEVNPGTVDIKDLQDYYDAGFNRISIGLQSAYDEDLKKLGRIHNFDDFMLIYEAARKVGFQNINVDLMSALPGQTLEKYRNGLHKVLDMKPEHISAYSLIIEENTPFYEYYVNNDEAVAQEYMLPSEEEERAMYVETEQILAQYGYQRYEISNYAKPGYECRHNLVYWQGGDYLGVGLGASSMLEHVRFKGIDCLKDYLNRWEISERPMEIYERSCDKTIVVSELVEFLNKNGYQQIESLSVNEQMEEFMFLGLRCMEGISADKFERRFGKPLSDIYGKQLTKLSEQGLIKCEEKMTLTKKDTIWSLTKRGIDVSNMVFVEFLLS